MSKLERFIRKLSGARSDSEGSFQEEEITYADIEKDYELIWSRIGSGLSGSTYTCVSRFLNYKYALKIVEDSKQNRKEIHFQRRCQQSEHVVPIIDVYRCTGKHPNAKPGVKYLYIIMELQREGNLFYYIHRQGRLREETAVRFMKQIVLGLQSIHKQGIIHRDLKPDNILISEREENNELYAKLCDFGFSCEESSRPVRADYTSYYVAPEVLCKDRDYNPHPTPLELAPYDHHCDLWSLGVTLYCMLVGDTPFFPEINFVPVTRLMYDNIQNARYRFPTSLDADISADAKHLISGLLRPVPEERLSLDLVLSHPWFNIA